MPPAAYHRNAGLRTGRKRRRGDRGLLRLQNERQHVARRNGGAAVRFTGLYDEPIRLEADMGPAGDLQYPF